MPPAELMYSPPTRPSKNKMDVQEVLRSIDEACAQSVPGDLFPSYREWVKRLNASERSVRWALEELQREGKIVRRQGAGTYVTDPSAHLNGNRLSNGTVKTSALVDSKTVVAIATPDRSIFDHALGLLFSRVEEQNLSLVCRLVTATAPAQLPPAGSENPLGYIVFRRDLMPVARQLQAAGQRVVLIGSPHVSHALGVPNVHGAHETGGCLAARHLIELGHRRIAFHGNVDLLQTSRWIGYQRGVAEAQRKGVKVKASVISMEQINAWRADLNVARRFFESPDAPTAIVAWNDHEAIMLLNLLTHIGLRVPDDISLVGYDNLPQGALMQPALTTIDAAIEQQLEAALGILTASEPLPPTHTTLVLPALVRRDSSAPVRST